VDAAAVSAAQAALKAEGAVCKLVAPSAAPVQGGDGSRLVPDGSMAGLPSIMFDAVLVPGGEAAVQAMAADGTALHYLLEAYKHLKTIALLGEARTLPGQLRLDEDEGLLAGADLAAVLAPFISAIARHRVWARTAKAMSVPA
jgi:catalase